MTITEAVKYNEITDSMTDAAFVGAWIDARAAEFIAEGMGSTAAYCTAYALVDAVEDAAA